jgi:hypothetical protein
MAGIYTVSFDGVSVSAAQDLFAVVAPSNTAIVLLGFELGVGGGTADAGDAQEELLRLRIRSGQTTAGSGGSAATPVNTTGGGGAASFSARVNDTTQASGGTIVVHWTGAFNPRAGFDKVFTDLQQIVLPAGRRATVELVEAPADALLLSGTLWVLERE